jgi:hypothetical protein
MGARWIGGRTLRVLLAALTLAGVLVAATPGGASASACASCWTEFQTVNPSPHYNVLHGAAVLSPSSAWAVGRYRNGTTLIEHLERHVLEARVEPEPEPCQHP